MFASRRRHRSWIGLDNICTNFMPIKVRRLKQAWSLSHSRCYCFRGLREERESPGSLSAMVVNFDVGKLFPEFSLWVISMAGKALGPGLLPSLCVEGQRDGSCSPFCWNEFLNTWFDIFLKGSTFSCLLSSPLGASPTSLHTLPPTLTPNFTVIGKPGANFFFKLCTGQGIDRKWKISSFDLKGIVIFPNRVA